MNHPKRGMTLVEVLAAIGVLVVGMTAIATMLVTSARFGKKALDRNTVAAVISEAVADIERRHLITPSMSLNGAPPVPMPADEVGLYIETVNSADVPSIHTLYGDVTLDGGTHKLSKTLDSKFLTSPDKSKIHYAVWPLPTENPKFIGGMGRTVPASDLELASGTAIRILYKLERHQDWHVHTFDTNSSSGTFGTVSYNLDPSDPVNNPEEATYPNSPFRGVYVLTMVVYKQLNRDMSSIEQISDPYVVHLRDKRVRN